MMAHLDILVIQDRRGIRETMERQVIAGIHRTLDSAVFQGIAESAVFPPTLEHLDTVVLGSVVFQDRDSVATAEFPECQGIPVSPGSLDIPVDPDILDIVPHRVIADTARPLVTAESQVIAASVEYQAIQAFLAYRASQDTRGQVSVVILASQASQATAAGAGSVVSAEPIQAHLVTAG
jgi:hypothetical protein